ncbi:MAG: aldo/keto reductase [Clostridiales bacterium]|jgi:diketogulonate reductase-like aldo/keto reductase|nr:aldo/keto reductase [Clostridiales bacterium]
MKIISKTRLKMPALGQGTWRMGEDPANEANEIEALRTGLSYGMAMIDTAEMYGDGKSEKLIGKAIAGVNRDDVYLVSKVYPYNAGRANIFVSCNNSLQRLGVDCLDLYLLHWRGRIPLKETIECMEELVRRQKIKHWGVSNFDLNDMEEIWRLPGGKNCAVNQVLYHLGSRGVEFNLLPSMRYEGVIAMAYCPLGGTNMAARSNITHNKKILGICEKYDITVSQLMLAFILKHQNVAAIPKASRSFHSAANAKAYDIEIDEDDWDIVNKEFPAPTKKIPLDME